MEIEKRINILENKSFLENIFLPVIKQIKYPKKQITIFVVNKERSEKLKKIIKEKYKLILDYPNENNDIVGIEIFYQGDYNE